MFLTNFTVNTHHVLLAGIPMHLNVINVSCVIGIKEASEHKYRRTKTICIKFTHWAWTLHVYVNCNGFSNRTQNHTSKEKVQSQLQGENFWRRDNYKGKEYPRKYLESTPDSRTSAMRPVRATSQMPYGSNNLCNATILSRSPVSSRVIV